MNLPTQELSVESLRSWNLLSEFRKLLKDARQRSNPKGVEKQKNGGPQRLLLEDDYYSSILFTLLNPVITSMRGFCACSALDKVQEQVSSRKVSLGSFSEAQQAFDPELLRQVFGELAQHSKISWGDKRLEKLAGPIALVDGSLIPALPRMGWALWQNDQNKAAKLHLKFNVLTQSASDAIITHGNSCERAALRKLVKKGEVIVGDRYYGGEYNFLDELRDLGASFVIRIRNNPRVTLDKDLTESKKEKELAITDEDKAAGVYWQGMVALGDKWKGEPIRLVCIMVDGKKIVLATNLEIEAELIALIYKYRWQVELFFKWLKSTLGCRHLLAQSPEGVSIQIYCALIASLLLQAFTGKKTNKREMEAIRFYMLGFMSLDELHAALKIEEVARKNRA